MRLIFILALVCLGWFSVPARAAKPAGDLHTFYGILKVVDPVAKTFTIKSGAQLLVFHYNDDTKINSEWGYVRWTTVKPGVGANVQMRLGEGNIGVAVRVHFVVDQGRAESIALFSVRTVQGERISGVAVSNYVLAEPPPTWSRAASTSEPPREFSVPPCDPMEPSIKSRWCGRSAGPRRTSGVSSG